MSGISEVRNQALRAGDRAPDFELPVLRGGVKGRFRLSEWSAKKLFVLAFYPSNWQEASAQQIVEYQSHREEYVRLNAEVVTISVDSIMNTTAWERAIGPFDFPMCSDYWPHGEVSQRYGVFRDAEPFRGAAERALILLDANQTVRFTRVYPCDLAAPFEDVLQALQGIVA